MRSTILSFPSNLPTQKTVRVSVGKSRTRYANPQRIGICSSLHGCLGLIYKGRTGPNTGKPFIDDRPVRRWAWTPTLKKLGIRHRPDYNTRHTCATVMLMAGSNPDWAAKQLGHSIKMFLETYSRWIDGDDKGRELSKMAHLLSSKTSKCAQDAHKISK
jgi:integrase